MSYIQEEWKPVLGFQDCYQVSNHGNVRRICPYCGPSHSRIVQRRRTTQGYIYYNLSRCGKQKKCMAHVLVAEAFIGPRPPGMWVNHKDGDKGNPYLGNLEYVTPSGNHIHAVMNGLRPRMKLNAAVVLEIRKLEGFEGSTTVAKRFGVTKTHVLAIWKRKVWAHLADTPTAA